MANQDGGRYYNFPITMLRENCNVVSVSELMLDILGYSLYSECYKKHGINNFDANICQKVAGEISLNFHDHIKRSFEKGKKLFNKHLLESPPFCGISSTVLWDYYKNKKTASEVDQLFAFLALKSIVQSKPYGRCTNENLLTRMAGYAKISEFNENVNKDNNAKALQKRLNNWRQFQKLRLYLFEQWHIVFVTKGENTGIKGGWYFSTKLTLDQLSLAYVNNSIGNRIKKQKEHETAAIREARQRIKNL